MASDHALHVFIDLTRETSLLGGGVVVFTILLVLRVVAFLSIGVKVTILLVIIIVVFSNEISGRSSELFGRSLGDGEILGLLGERVDLG